MKKYFIFNDEKIFYTIKTNKKLKNLYITISPYHGVIVKNPNFPLERIEKIISQKAAWIYKKTKILDSKQSIEQIYEKEGKLLFLGNKIDINDNVNIEVFYKEKTKEIVTPLVEKYSKMMSLTPNEVKFRKAKRRWGSCNGKNCISFNSSLSQLPLPCIEYIIVHELSHILHKHHQRDFWLHVEKFMPSFKEQEKELKKYFPAISINL